MDTTESSVNFEHSIFKIKNILFNLFPGANIHFNADWLDKKIPDKPRTPGFVYSDYRILYSSKKSIHQGGKEYKHYKIAGNTENARQKLKEVISHVYRNSKALTHKWEESKTEFSWFEFKSEAELAIAEELYKRNILFFCNAKCSITNTSDQQERMMPDFLVVYQGKARILEVDGLDNHKEHFLDYRRDRLFERHGLRVTRYTYDECIANSKRVIDEFLELFEDGINYFHQLIRMFQSNQPV